MTELRYIDLFSGAGGLSLGMFNAHVKGVFAIEKNQDAFSTLKHNLIENKNHFDWPTWLPIANLDIENVLAEHKNSLINLKGKIDLIIGGPPCQGFSFAGKRDFLDVRNGLVFSYLDMVRIVDPKYVFFENVVGIKTKFSKDTIELPYSQIIINELEDMGYKVNFKTVIMSDFGIPQNRKRFIIFASKNNLAEVFFDKLLEQKEDFLATKGLSTENTVGDAIDDLCMFNGTVKSPDSSQKFKNGLYGVANSSYQELMRKGSSRIPDSHRFPKHSINIIHLHKEIQKYATPGKRISIKDNIFPNLKRRGVTLLDKKGLSPTITSSPDEIIHYLEPRILTPRETARLQSFPDWYQFKGKYTSGGKLRKFDVPRYTQIGNAVPPLFAEQVGVLLRSYKEERDS